MPRGLRLDAPGVLHHVMVRGIERRAIFRTDTDREDFVAHLAALAEAGAVTVYAWALLPNHAHLLVRSGHRPLARSMRSLLTGYAGAFNRRHQRAGHLFQNRYKSIVVEAEPHLLELVRYLHLNPVRAGIVPDLRGLDRFPWTGHSTLLGQIPRAWQDRRTVLAQFGPTPTQARQLVAYLWVEHLGRVGSDLARVWGWSLGQVSWAAKRGAEVSHGWRHELEEWCG